ncbi:hypothetical protein H2202_005456 [Exophiala xenobiotica]|nr:hypothetical protein H2202_005456 [Exophiala xenobiotica]
MPVTTRAMARRHQRESTDVQFKYFLGLPLEIRTEIYSYIAACPETRHSLMAVSRQISEECTPLIFRQLRFTIHAPYPLSALQAEFSPNTIRFAPRCTPDAFDRVYLRKISGSRLRNIHSLCYNVVRPTFDKWHSPEADCSGMEELGRVLLSHSGSLECLEEVTIYLKPGIGLTLSEVKTDKEKIWSLVSEKFRWDKIEQEVGWKVSRRIDLGDVRVGGVNLYHVLKYISSMFRKTKDNQTPGQSMPVPTLMVQHVT